METNHLIIDISIRMSSEKPDTLLSSREIIFITCKTIHKINDLYKTPLYSFN